MHVKLLRNRQYSVTSFNETKYFRTSDSLKVVGKNCQAILNAVLIFMHVRDDSSSISPKHVAFYPSSYFF